MYRMLLGFGALGIALYFIGNAGDSIPLQIGGFTLVAIMFSIFMHQKMGRKF